MLSLQAALTEPPGAAPARLGRPTAPLRSGSGGLARAPLPLVCPVPGQPGLTQASSGDP